MVYSDISAHLLILIPTSRSDSIQESFLRIKTRSPLWIWSYWDIFVVFTTRYLIIVSLRKHPLTPKPTSLWSSFLANETPVLVIQINQSASSWIANVSNVYLLFKSWLMIDVGGSPDYFQIFETEILNKPRIKLKSSSAFLSHAGWFMPGL